MHDASYIHCVRLAGSKTAMGSLLTAHFHQNFLSECVVAPDGHMSLSMRRLLFHDRAYLVAPVDIIVRESQDHCFHVGIWVHVGATEQVLAAIATTKLSLGLILL